jgi:hypothetical protein
VDSDKWTPSYLDNPTYTNPTFTAAEIIESTDFTVQLTVTNEEGISSEPDEVVITVNPLVTPPPNEEPKTIEDLIKDIMKNLLDVTRSIEIANEIKDILSDDNLDNDKRACNLLDRLSSDQAASIRNMLKCYRSMESYSCSGAE